MIQPPGITSALQLLQYVWFISVPPSQTPTLIVTENMLPLTQYQQVILEPGLNFFYFYSFLHNRPTQIYSCSHQKLFIISLQLLHLHPCTPTSAAPTSSSHLVKIQPSGLFSNTSAYITSNISPSLPHNTLKILWKPIQGSPTLCPPPLLPSSSSTSSSVYSSEWWERRINTLPPKSTLGMIDGQMQEGRKGGGGEIKGKEVWDFINPKRETWSASHINKISKKSMMRERGVKRVMGAV